MQTTHYNLNTPCSIALVTDFHNRPPAKVTAALAALNPDIICIAGDTFYGGIDAAMDNQHNVMPFFAACADIAPTFLSFGNHDWAITKADMSAIADLGVNVLDNTWTPHNGLVIGGLTSGITLGLRKTEWNAETTSTPPETSWLSDFEEQQGFRILLCHHPEYYPRYLRSRSIDLILAGHAHGGQWRLFNHGLFAPGQGLFPKLTSGIHDNLVISRGLANTTWIPRINNPCEIVYISSSTSS